MKTTKILFAAVLLAATLVTYAFTARLRTETWREGVFYQLPSDVISIVYYRRDLGLLTLGFQKGQVYEYASVPEGIFHGLMNSIRKGEFYNQRIRGKFPSRRIQLSNPGPTI